MSDVTRRKFLGAAAGGTALALLKPSELFAKQKVENLMMDEDQNGNYQ
jgi:hypothetical protein